MRYTLKRVGIVALVALLAVGAASGAVTFDEEATNTATTSDVDSGVNAIAYNTSEDIYLEFETEGTASGFNITDPESGEELVSRNVSEDSVAQSYADLTTTPSTYYWETNVSIKKFSGVEMEAGESKTFEVTIINDTRATATNPKTTTQNFTLENDGKRTFLVLEDSEVGSSGLAELASETTFGYQLPWNTDVATIDQSVPINGSGTTATIDVENSTVAERFASSSEGAESSEWTMSTLATVDDEPVRVYADEAPDDVDGETYIVHDTSSDELEIHFGDDVSGESADVWMVANKGWTSQLQHYGLSALGL